MSQFHQVAKFIKYNDESNITLNCILSVPLGLLDLDWVLHQYANLPSSQIWECMNLQIFVFKDSETGKFATSTHNKHGDSKACFKRTYPPEIDNWWKIG
jgi:hypothetical protein